MNILVAAAAYAVIGALVALLSIGLIALSALLLIAAAIKAFVAALKIIFTVLAIPFVLVGMLAWKLGGKRFDSAKEGEPTDDEFMTAIAASGRCCMRDLAKDGNCDLHPDDGCNQAQVVR